MTEEQTNEREELEFITQAIAEALSQDESVTLAQVIGSLTGHKIDNNKIVVKFTNGEIFRFAIAAIRTRSK